jgi:hypothetical protein
VGAINFDLSWLDGLPAAGDSKLHDGGMAISSLVNPRVLIAEVLEWQGRHKEAIRCAMLFMLTYANSRSHNSRLFNLAALQQPTSKIASTSPLRQRFVQAG